MANGTALEEDFISQLMRALGQRTNFSQDLTNALTLSEAQFDDPNQFSQVFDLGERNRLRTQGQAQSLGSINAIQNQLDQRNQSFGDFAQSVNRGIESARGQANLDRDFAFRQSQAAQAQANINREFGASQAGQEDDSFLQGLDVLLKTGQTPSQLGSFFPSLSGAQGPDLPGGLSALNLPQEQPSINEQIALDRAAAGERKSIFDFVDKLKQGDARKGVASVTADKEIAQKVNRRFGSGTASRFGFGISAVARELMPLIQQGTPQARKKAEEIISRSGYSKNRLDRFIADLIKETQVANDPHDPSNTGTITFDRSNRQVTF